MIGKDGVRYMFHAVCAMTSGNWSNPDDLRPGCGWKSGWYETPKEAKEAGRRHSPNCCSLTGTSSKVADPSNRHMVGIERLAQNAQTGYGIDVMTDSEAAWKLQMQISSGDVLQRLKPPASRFTAPACHSTQG